MKGFLAKYLNWKEIDMGMTWQVVCLNNVNNGLNVIG